MEKPEQLLFVENVYFLLIIIPEKCNILVQFFTWINCASFSSLSVLLLLLFNVQWKLIYIQKM